MKKITASLFLLSILFLLFLSLNALAANVQYTYDDLNRLVQETYEDGTTVVYTYDEAGNRLGRVVSGTGGGSTVPGAPTNVVATAGDSQASVTFTAPASNGGSPITGYKVVSHPGATVATGTASPIVVTGLPNGTIYTFTVCAINANGTGPASNPSNAVTPMGRPAPPTSVIASPGDGQATVAFTPGSNGGSQITGYRVVSSPGGFNATGGASPITVTGLTNGTAYTFTVIASNSRGDSPPSLPSNGVTPFGLPGAPTGVSATADNAMATVVFTAPVSNGGIPITEYTATSSPGGITAKAISSPITVTGLSNGTSYTFSVTAKNAAGVGPASSPSNSVTPATVPDPPIWVYAYSGIGQAMVGFAAPAWNGGSPITSYTVNAKSGGNTIATVTGTSSPLTVTGLTPGIPCFFTMTATNARGTGAASKQSNGIRPLKLPDAPSGVTATAGNTRATISFTPPALSDGDSPITGYIVVSSPGGITKTGQASPLTVPGLTNGTAYTFTVKATSRLGTGPASVQSNSVTPSTQAQGNAMAPASNGSAAGLLNEDSGTAPTVPGPVPVVMAEAGDAQATVVFPFPPSSDGGGVITDYTATSSPGGITATGTASPLTVTGLANGTVYTFTVTATNSAGTGQASGPSNSVTPQAAGSEVSSIMVPGPVPVVMAEAGDAQATVVFPFPPSSGGGMITGYTATSSPGGITATGTASPLTITGLANGTVYTFTVTATNSAGTGQASGPSNSVTPQAAETE